jgi:predicted aminopeptidase
MFLQAEARATESRVTVERLSARMTALTASLTVERLDGDIATRRYELFELEQDVRQIYADPELNSPMQAAKRRQLQKLEARLARLRAAFESQRELKHRLEMVVDVNDRLCAAAAAGELGTAQSLLLRGVSVNVHDRNGFNPMHYACGAGHVEVARLLIDRCVGGAGVVRHEGDELVERLCTCSR